MDLTFNQVEAVFARRFQVPEQRAVAFRGRLQHLQRMNFPSDVNTGRGRKAVYGWQQVIQLMVALELIDLGITPDVAAKSVLRSTDPLIAAIYSLACGFGSIDALGKAIERSDCPFGMTYVALTSANALTLSYGEHDAQTFISTCSGMDFMKMMTEQIEVQHAMVYVDLGAQLIHSAQLITACVALSPYQLAEDLLEWSSNWYSWDDERGFN